MQNDLEELVPPEKGPPMLSGIDWDELRKQKLTLLAMRNELVGRLDTAGPISAWVCGIRANRLTGILHLIDSLQDEAVDTGFKTEEEVFGKLEGT
jgi:hypothetical protein